MIGLTAWGGETGAEGLTPCGTWRLLLSPRLCQVKLGSLFSALLAAPSLNDTGTPRGGGLIGEVGGFQQGMPFIIPHSCPEPSSSFPGPPPFIDSLESCHGWPRLPQWHYSRPQPHLLHCSSSQLNPAPCQLALPPTPSPLHPSPLPPPDFTQPCHGWPRLPQRHSPRPQPHLLRPQLFSAQPRLLPAGAALHGGVQPNRMHQRWWGARLHDRQGVGVGCVGEVWERQGVGRGWENAGASSLGGRVGKCGAVNGWKV